MDISCQCLVCDWSRVNVVAHWNAWKSPEGASAAQLSGLIVSQGTARAVGSLMDDIMWQSYRDRRNMAEVSI